MLDATGNTAPFNDGEVNTISAPSVPDVTDGTASFKDVEDDMISEAPEPEATGTTTSFKIEEVWMLSVLSLPFTEVEVCACSAASVPDVEVTAAPRRELVIRLLSEVSNTDSEYYTQKLLFSSATLKLSSLGRRK